MLVSLTTTDGWRLCALLGCDHPSCQIRMALLPAFYLVCWIPGLLYLILYIAGTDEAEGAGIGIATAMITT